jgi:tetratricopeptide (TPR) repeat protein
MAEHNKITEGRDYQQRAAENALLLPSSDRRHDLLLKIIEALQQTGNHAHALEYYQRMFHEQLTGGNKNPLLCAGLHNELATTFEDQNDYVSALHHYQVALQLLVEHHITRDNLIATCFYNTGMVHRKLKNTKGACTSFLSALGNLSSSNQDPQLTVRITLNLGHAYYDAGEWKEAEENYENARELSFKIFTDPNHPWVTKCQEYLNQAKLKLLNDQQSTDNQ